MGAAVDVAGEAIRQGSVTHAWRTDKGRVYLVGAGPGDHKLLTLKAAELLTIADVVIYDQLVSSAVLNLIQKKAKKIYAGKSAKGHTLAQEQINEILVQEAKKGNIVVRLKGGDPFILGRGGEEAEALKAADIPFEVVPGITSALAVPAYAGIPLTHRKYASSVAIVAGHEDPSKAEGRVKWEKLATAVDTIVILMGMGRLDAIVKALLLAGRAPRTPIAIVEQGTTGRQRTILGRLVDIREKATMLNAAPPAVIVVGEAAALSQELSWFETETFLA